MLYYDVDHMLNFRDIGMWKSGKGPWIKPWTLLRSDCPKMESTKLIPLLKEHHIDTVIDLRTIEVVERFPNPLAADPFFSYHNYPIEEGSSISLSSMPIPDLYLLAASHHELFCTIFRTIIEAPHGVLIHCTAGKDRTGVVIAILLDFLGVDPEVIAFDYALSTIILDHKVETNIRDNPDFPRFLGRCEPENMQAFIDLFYQKYQDADHYLRLIGLSDTQLQQLRMKAFQ